MLILLIYKFGLFPKENKKRNPVKKVLLRSGHTSRKARSESGNNGRRRDRGGSNGN